MGWFIFFLIIFAAGLGWFYLKKQQEKESKSVDTPEVPVTPPGQVTLNTIAKNLEGVGTEIGEIKSCLERIEKKLPG